MGSAYREGITIEEVNTFLGSGKFVNLNDGNYVDKDKYNKVVAEKDGLKKNLDDLTEKTKDYDTLKTENDSFKSEKADADLKAKLVGYGISEKSFKYVKSDINDKVLVIGDKDEDNKKAVEKYLKDNPQFANGSPTSGGGFGPTNINPKPIEQNGPKVVASHGWNKNRS